MADAPNDPVTQRVREEVVARIESRGVRTSPSDSSAQLADLLEAIESFEAAVERHGGDLMVDEPVRAGKTPQPDDIVFVLPPREKDEAASSFIARIVDATADVDRRR